MERLHLRISPTAEWKLRAGHPWLYDQSIVHQNRQGRLGELAVIYDRHDNFLAIGLFDPASPLRVRVLHRGKPQLLDAAWWRMRLHKTLESRLGMFDHQTTGYRCIHGESDGWPGLVLDRYHTALVLKLYTAAWLPRLAELLPLLQAELAPHQLVLRLSRNIQATAREFNYSDGQCLSGSTSDEPVVFLESGLRFEAQVRQGQKTGFFLDQRENRRIVENLAKGRDVLNAFSFSGGFSLYAARGGAQSVTDVDISAHALESGRRNFQLNQHLDTVRECLHQCVQADVFEWLAQSRSSRYGLVILDPPSLAKREGERARALDAYAALARSGIDALTANGILVAGSCSAHVSEADFFRTVRTAAERSGRQFEELRTTGQPADHPATFPEAHYLKCIYLRLL